MLSWALLKALSIRYLEVRVLGCSSAPRQVSDVFEPLDWNETVFSDALGGALGRQDHTTAARLIGAFERHAATRPYPYGINEAVRDLKTLKRYRKFGLMVRLWGQPDRDPFSIHLGGHLWVPIGVTGNHAGDGKVRGLPKLVLAGQAHTYLRWAFSLGFLVRGQASIGTGVQGPGNTVGSEIQIAEALGISDRIKRLNTGIK